MAKTINVTVTSRGADVGNITVTSYNGTTLIAGWTKTIASTVPINTVVQYTDVDETATKIRIAASGGSCSNYADLTIS
jgi:carbon monoxide dehydrogenase subunit G